MIRKRLARRIVVKEVMLRDIELPQSMPRARIAAAEGTRERPNGRGDRNHQKQVKIAEADADASKVQQVKQAEDKPRRVLQAKSEADAMQYTLPLKKEQIEQSKLEAEARKEATVKNAERPAKPSSSTARRGRTPQAAGASRSRAHR